MPSRGGMTLGQQVQNIINRIRNESQVKFQIVEEYIEYRQQTNAQEARNLIITKYMPQGEFYMEIIGPKHEIPMLRNKMTQNLNNYCNEAESLFFQLAGMK